MPPHSPLRLGLVLGLMLAAGWPGAAHANPNAPDTGLRIETGLDVLSDPQTQIRGLHRLFVGVPLGRGLHLGQSIYSAAMGDAGGAFFWGFELTKTLPLGPRLSAEAGAFLGGGGGAAQVVGNGLVKRAHLGLSYALSNRMGLGIGASYITIDGADINGPAFGATLTYALGAQGGGAVGAGGGANLRSAALGASAMVLSGTNRSGTDQSNVGLIGAEAAFHMGAPGREALLSADGGATGAEGYMQILGGLRQRVSFGKLSAFAEARAGLGGGGNVDTGSGLLLGLGGGLAWQIAPWADVELGLDGVVAPFGEMQGAQASLRLVRVFNRTAGTQANANPQAWAFSLGMSAQMPNAGFHKPNTPGHGAAIMQESSIDLMLGRHLYLTGNAQTTMGGHVAGYALGLVGLGWTQPLAPRWDIAFEGQIGAAGGGGVNTSGGLVAGLRAEVDYALSDRLHLSLGLGQMRTLQGGGMAPVVAQLGLKIPFTTP